MRAMRVTPWSLGEKENKSEVVLLRRRHGSRPVRYGDLEQTMPAPAASRPASCGSATPVPFIASSSGGTSTSSAEAGGDDWQLLE